MEDEYIIVANKSDKVIFTTESQLEAIRMIKIIWDAEGDADLFKKVPTVEVNRNA